MEQMAEYQDTRELYATALAYVLKERLDDIYIAQSLVIVSGMAYAIATNTAQGLYAQTDVGAIFPVDHCDLEYLKKL